MKQALAFVILLQICSPAFADQNVACSASALVSALETAIAAGGEQTVNLAAGCTYTLTVDKSGDSNGPNGLPMFTAGNITINGNGATIERSSSAIAFRFFEVRSAATLNLNNLTLRGGLTRTSTDFSQGDAENGGAILNSGTMTITDCTVIENQCGVGFAGDAEHPETDGGSGGGILNAGTMTIKRSLIANNKSGNGGGQDGAPGLGGGIDNSGTLKIVNSTICNNSTGTGYPSSSGGGVHSSLFSGNVDIINSTICSNTDSVATGGGIFTENEKVTLTNTIVSNNSPKNCTRNLKDGGHNLESADTCGFDASKGSLKSQNPGLGALANNGGKTQTASISTTSPAANAGDDDVCGGSDVSAEDQRGTKRPVGTHCDIGAFEAGTSASCKKKPSTPTLLSPKNNFSTKVGKVPFSWQSTECATSYNIVIRAGSKSGSTTLDKGVKTATSYTSKTLKPSSYFWLIEACNKKGCVESKSRKFTVKK